MSNMREQIKFYSDLYKHYFKNKFSQQIPYNQKLQSNIPKILHFCWFGGNPYPDLMKKCIASWEEFLPEYELKLWNEDSFPIETYRFTKEAYENKKYAFVSDFVRLHALYNEGGIYMDTDVEIIKPLDVFLHHGVFSGYESDHLISTGLMGAKKQHPWIALLLNWYDNRHFQKYDATTANTRIISKITALNYGVKLNGQYFILKDDVHMYPANYFCPRETLTENSYCIHHFAGSWKSIK